MQWRVLVLVSSLVGCGRFGFEPTGAGGGQAIIDGLPIVDGPSAAQTVIVLTTVVAMERRAPVNRAPLEAAVQEAAA